MSTITVTINDETSQKDGRYKKDNDTEWHNISGPIPVSNQIFIKLNTDGNFTICFNMDGSSTNVMFTAEFMGTNIWKLSNFTGDTLQVTIKDPA